MAHDENVGDSLWIFLEELDWWTQSYISSCSSILGVERKRDLEGRIHFEIPAPWVATPPVLPNSASWALANQLMDPPCEPQPSHYPLAFLLWEIHHPYPTPRMNKLETCEAVKLCFINICIYMSDLNFFWSWVSHLSLQLVHCFGTWQMVGVWFILWTLLITEGLLFQEQNYSPGWVEVAYLDRSIWQSVIRQLWLHPVYWFLAYFGCLSLDIDASPRTNKPREPQPLES